MTIEQTYNGTVLYFREDGYFNMTKAAKAFGKCLEHFFDNKETQDYIGELAATYRNSGDKELVVVKHGNGLLPAVDTWGHPKLAVFFSRWLDVKFSVWCDQAIERILRDGMYVVGEKKVSTGELSEDEFILRAFTILQNKVERLKQ